jgi:transcriptional regulator with XRE-family HTH domain
MPYYIIGDGDELRRRRERAGLTQEELAEEAGVARNTVISAEAGYAVRKSTLRKLARALVAEPRWIGRWYD